MLTNRVQALLNAKQTLSDIPFKELFDAIALLQDQSDRDFIATLLNYHLATQQKLVLTQQKPLDRQKTHYDKDDLLTGKKTLNLIIGIDGVGKSTFYSTAYDLFKGSVFAEKKRHSLYKFCQRCFTSGLALTIEAKLTLDDYDLIPIIELAKNEGYTVLIYTVVADSPEEIHDRLSARDNSSPFTGHDLSAMQFFSQQLEDDLLNYADRFVVIDNSRQFNLVQLKT